MKPAEFLASLAMSASGLPLFMESAPHNGTPTSRDAAHAIKPHVSRQRAEVLAFICGRPDGATAQEIEHATGLAGNSIRPRLVELRENGCIRDAGFTRRTRSGRKAVVWEFVR